MDREASWTADQSGSLYCGAVPQSVDSGSVGWQGIRRPCTRRVGRARPGPGSEWAHQRGYGQKDNDSLMLQRTKLKSLGLVAMVAAGLVLAGCSSSSTTSTTTSSTRAASSTSTSSAATTIPYNPALNARSDVTAGTCIYADGEWQLEGKVRNSAATPRSYQIVIDFITQPGDTVQDTKIVDVTNVASGATATWATAGAPGQHNLACVVRQVQAQ